MGGGLSVYLCNTYMIRRERKEEKGREGQGEGKRDRKKNRL